MNDLPFFECPEETKFSKEIFKAIGRALYIAQEFEAKCRSLAVFCTVKKAHVLRETGPLDDPKFHEFIDELWRRQLGDNIKVLRLYGFPDKKPRFLNKARIARNEIAHNITARIEWGIENDENRKKILKGNLN